MSYPPQQPGAQRASLRASDADRDRLAALLRDHYSEGRLTFEEFQERLEAAYAARTFGQLDELTRDLPAPAAPKPRPPQPQRHPVPAHAIRFAVLCLLFIVIVAASGMHHIWSLWPVLIIALAVAFRATGGSRTRRSRPRDRRQSRRERRLPE